MESSSKVKGEGQARGMSQFPGQGEGLMAPREGLVWIAKQSQAPAHPGKTHRSSVMPIEEGMGAVLLRIVESKSLF